MIAAITAERVVACLTQVERGAHDDSTSHWHASTLDLAGGGVFGGELLGQAATIASKLDPRMPVKSMHAVFPRGTRDVGSLEFVAHTLHNGRAYSTQRIEVAQPDHHGTSATSFSVHVICHGDAVGFDHQLPMPAAGSPDHARPVDLGLIPWDTRVVGATDLDDREAQPNELLLWTRVGGGLLDGLADELVVHQALLAFLSDLTLIGTAMLPHQGWSQLDAHAGLRTSVISHQVLFHRPFRIDDWLLIAQSSPVAAGGSAFGFGHVFAESGELVATISQESMIRIAEGSAS